MLYNVVQTFESVDEILKLMTIQMKATEKYFSVALFTMLYKVVLALQPKETIPRGVT